MKNSLCKTFLFLTGYRKKYFSGLIGMTVIRTTAILIQSFLLYYVLNLNEAQSTGELVKTVLFFIIYVILLTILLPVFQFWFNGNAKYGFGNVNKALFRKIEKMPVEFLKGIHSGKIMSFFLNDAWMVASIFMRHFRRIISAFISILIYLIPMIILNYKVTIIILVINILSMIVNVKLSKEIKKLTKRIQDNYAILMMKISEAFSSMVTIRIYDMKKIIFELYESENKSIQELELKRAGISNFLNAYNFAVGILSLGIFLIMGGYLQKNGLQAYGSVLALLSLQRGLDSNFRELGEYIPRFNSNLAATERVYNFLNMPEENSNGGKKLNKGLSEELEFKNVSFGYTKTNVINDFNLKLKKGDYVVLTGESGCGKSTIAKLLMGFYLIDDGEILIDNININDLSLYELRDNFAYIPQEPMMYNETIYENIRYGNYKATEEEIMVAAQKAGAYEFIMKQENGFYTYMGENGSKLSGGQLQRIALARAILKNAKIILLDEATASLDNKSEKMVLKSVKELKKEKIIIAIAHKSLAINDADRIIEIV